MPPRQFPACAVSARRGADTDQIGSQRSQTGHVAERKPSSQGEGQPDFFRSQAQFGKSRDSHVGEQVPVRSFAGRVDQQPAAAFPSGKLQHLFRTRCASRDMVRVRNRYKPWRRRSCCDAAPAQGDLPRVAINRPPIARGSRQPRGPQFQIADLQAFAKAGRTGSANDSSASPRATLRGSVSHPKRCPETDAPGSLRPRWPDPASRGSRVPELSRRPHRLRQPVPPEPRSRDVY